MGKAGLMAGETGITVLDAALSTAGKAFTASQRIHYALAGGGKYRGTKQPGPAAAH